jgi:hypothetical protein
VAAFCRPGAGGRPIADGIMSSRQRHHDGQAAGGIHRSGYHLIARDGPVVEYCCLLTFGV